MDKLIKAKAIMNKSDSIKRGDIPNISSNSLQEFDAPNAKYNIPQEFLQEKHSQSYQSVSSVKPVGVPSIENIKNSKLPDEIKKLMIEHPIAQPNQQQTTISDDLIERASRLMNVNKKETQPTINEQTTKKQTTSNIDYKLIQKMIEDSINKSLRENGLLVESSEKSNETFSFRVGKHLFEGKVTKIKKIQ